MSATLIPPTELPPGPAFAPLQLARYVRDSSGYLMAGLAKYGDPFLFRPIGHEQVVTADPESIERIYAAPPGTFSVGTPEVLFPIVGESSLLVKNGAEHQRERKLLMPPFHGSRMRAYGGMIRDTAREAGQRLQLGEAFRALDLTQHIAIEVILRAVFGVVEPQRCERYRHAIEAFVAAINPLFLLLSSLRSRFFRTWRRFLRARAELDALIYEDIERRQSAQPAEDILSLLIASRYDDGSAMTRQELRDELLTVLFAGHETSAVTIAWALYELHRAPQLLQTLAHELDKLPEDSSPDELVSLPYLDAVCNETLRLHPVVANVPKRLNVPMQLGAYMLPAGTAVTIAYAAVHQRPDLYPEPTRFRPGRFLERKFGPFEFLPFGGGNRRCLGAAFATYEIKVALAELIRRNRFRLSGTVPERTVLRNVTLGPACGVPMVLEHAS